MHVSCMSEMRYNFLLGTVYTINTHLVITNPTKYSIDFSSTIPKDLTPKGLRFETGYHRRISFSLFFTFTITISVDCSIRLRNCGANCNLELVAQGGLVARCSGCICTHPLANNVPVNS